MRANQALAAMDDNVEIAVSTSVIVFGQRHFIERVVIPLSEALEEISREHPASPEERAWRPELPTGYYASFTGIAGIVGTVVFVRSWLGKKVLDEIYDRAIKPKLNKVLGDFFDSDESEKKYGATLVINNLPLKVSILIVVVGKDLSEIEVGEKQVSSVISTALDTAQKIAKPNTVHLYLIESGQVNSHPWIYDNLEQAMRHMNKMSAARPPKSVRAGS